MCGWRMTYETPRSYVLIEGEEEDINEALKALQACCTVMSASSWAMNLNMRHAPHLHFARDTAEERAARIATLLEDLAPEKDETQERLADGE